MIDSRFSDSQLVSLYQTGNEEAFDMLLRRHKSRIYTAIYMIVKDRYEAEDLLQDTFIKVIQTLKGGKYNEEGKFLPWVMRISHNLMIDYFRKEKRFRKVSGKSRDNEEYDVFSTIGYEELNMEERLIKAQVKTDVKELIERLPDEQKDEIQNLDERSSISRAAGQTQGRQQQVTETIVREQPKIGRNDKVTIKHVMNGESKTLKYKQAIPLINKGEWVLVE